MNVLANGLFHAGHAEDSLSVRETELSSMKRLGMREEGILATQSNLAGTYQCLGRHEQAASMYRDVYSGRVKLNGDEHILILRAAYNYATSLFKLKRFGEARSLLRKIMPLARRVLGNNNETTLTMRLCYARTLCEDTAATLDDIREAITTLEDIERTARRVLGGTHPTTKGIEKSLRQARAALRARERK